MPKPTQLDFNLKGGPRESAAPARPPEPEVLSVSALTRTIRSLIELGVGDVWVEGEVSNLRRQASGHMYFTLKDASSQVACVLFAGQAAQIRGAVVADGAQLQIFGQATVYEARGNYQIIVRRVRERGAGALQAKFDELKRRLADEGLFSQDRKRPLPAFPRRIGVVTSPTGAAIRDFLNVLHRRQKGIGVVIFPVRVQGKGAAAEIAEAVALLGDPAASGIGPVDVIVLTRGGGSLEDLWEFNEEVVARAIGSSAVPVVSAVGHEIDFTIADFAADVRAPTPSAAAEILSADAGELLARLAHLGSRLRRSAVSRFEVLRQRADGFRRTVLFSEPPRRLRQCGQDLDRMSDDLGRGASEPLRARRLVVERASGVLSSHSPAKKIGEALAFLERSRSAMLRCPENRLAVERSLLERNAALLGALNPSAALARGYTLTLDADGRLIRAAAAVSPGQVLTTRFADGTVRSVAG